MNLYGAEAAKERRRVVQAGIFAVVIIAAFLCGRYSVEWQHPILKVPAFQNLSYAYKEIMNGYLEGAEAKKLVDGATEGMVASLEDPYSVYLPGDEGESYMQSYEDHFVGIGVEVREEDKQFIIDTVIEGAPAEKAGIKAGDTIVAVDDQAAAGMESDKLLGLVRGEEGTEVTLTLLRAGEELKITVERGSVPVKTVSYEMREDGVGEITITRFADKTGEEFDEAMKALQEKGMKALLLDLRGNPGGLLDPTIHIANWFVPKGKTIVQVVSKDEKSVVTHKSEQKKAWTLPISVLVDSHSASSSEVLTAALKDTAGATVVGEKTYGKGIVQQFRQLKDGSVLKLTKAQWRSPNGQWIHKKGIEPTNPVSPPSYALLSALPTGINLKLGDYGDQVKTAEQMLKALGFLPGEVGGVYDEAMVEAVERFQKAQNIPVMGTVNDKTAYTIVTLLSDKYEKEDPQRLKAVELLKEAVASGASGSDTTS
ncbi:carboxyl-terminal processing protease [Paenibacillus phyllosphaerae]|uniref:Carboxyl-terminal processing protease n=1 Tax=Paenibacillus phyllosphaerae TaxID=274593 RepID=A0A7W5FQ79_9BACL|nr:S41 family peptidase [Paenibacillus phyllosphaerae]MBB3112947.1 carboxyl-terminal processing protease [Paenibacillus phyllosphaerae]